ncbi:MAG: Phosphate transport system permease protein PstC [Myxococcaceae bacterium]|nr:Phosphate transport system permease protein PstC [Myxococcaceae bacterium]MEA2750664.1 phosphate transport system permease protein [Myxococcales bacterium]
MSEPSIDEPAVLTPPPTSTPPRSGRSSGASSDVHDASRAWVDRALVAVGGGAACIVGIVLVGVAVSVLQLSLPSIRQLGFGFVLGRDWDPVHGDLGALPFLYGTMVTAAVALLLAVPVALGVALFLTDLGPLPLRRPVAALVELLAAVPGVVYGLWAAIVLAPLLRNTIEPALEAHAGFLPLFRGPKLGVGLLCASLVLAVMILPTIASMSREVLRAVPSELREGGLALGATRWDVVRRIVLPHAKSGIFGAILLGFGRAVGETMAVAMVVGSRAEITGSLFSPGYTMSSVIANEFAEATSTLHVAALAEIGLLLFAVTLAFNVAARILVARVRGPETALARVLPPPKDDEVA